jgi:3',5'-cyclic AMP phosphodiesterase CpdA
VTLDAETTTAGSTLVLALLTLVYVFLTGRVSRRAGESAAAAERSAQAAERSARAAEHAVDVTRFELMLNQMPRITLKAEAHASHRGGDDLDQLAVRIANRGRSRAVEVRVRLAGDLAGDHPMTLYKALDWSPDQEDLARFRSDERPASDILTALNDDDLVELEATYNDDFGNRFRTRVEMSVAGSVDSRPPRARSRDVGLDYEYEGGWKPLRWLAGPPG